MNPLRQPIPARSGGRTADAPAHGQRPGLLLVAVPMALLLIFSGDIFSAAAQPTGLAPAAQHVTGEAAAHAGLTRVDDLFWLLDGWSGTSIDGFTVRPSADGLPGTPLVLVDGRPVEPGIFGRPALPMLPVHPLQVQTARAWTAPRLAAGRLASDGTLALRLSPPAPGLAARGAVSAGNEVGDPGPFRTTERRVLNVDRIRPQYFGEASLRASDGASAVTSLRTTRHYTTDRLIRRRTEYAGTLDDGPPLQQLFAPRLALRSGRSTSGRHRLTAHVAALRALPHFEPLGYEVPARRTQARIDAQGTWPLSSKRKERHFEYRLGYRHATLRADPVRFGDPTGADLAFDWREHRLSSHAQLTGATLPSFGARLDAGASADYTSGRTAETTLADPDLLTTRVHATLHAPDAALRTQIELLLSQTNGRLGGGVLASSRLPLGTGTALGVHLTALRRPYAEDGSFWYWLAQGLPVPRAPSGRLALPGSFPASHRLSADLRLRRTLPDGGHLLLAAGVRHFVHLSLPLANYGFQLLAEPPGALPGGALVPDIRLLTGVSGQTFRVAYEGALAFPNHLHHRLRYDFFAYHGANATRSRRRAFDQRFARIPEHRLRYTAHLSVADRFALQGRLALRSPERWPAYTRAARAEGSSYRDRLPTRLRADLIASKRLWKQHLRLRLALRNLLDAPLRSHPAGPVQRLTLFFGIEAWV